MIRRAGAWIKARWPRKTEEEIWRPIVGYEGLYEVSNYGRVRSLSHQRKHQHPRLVPLILVPHQDISNPKKRSVGLTKNGCVVHRDIPHLVLEAFVGPCPPRHIAIHSDAPNSDALSNVRWISREEWQKARHMFKGEEHPMAKLTTERVKAIRAAFDSGARVCDLAREEKMSEGAIWGVVKRRKWKHLD